MSSSLYNEVQYLLDGKRTHLRQHNLFLFRLLIRCEHCKLYLVGERQKGHVYYRCHRKLCPISCIREERFETEVVNILKRINISPAEEPILKEVLDEFRGNESEVSHRMQRAAEDELERVQESIKTLLQRFLVNSISKDTFDEGHTFLLMQRKSSEDRLERFKMNKGIYEQTLGFIDHLRSICQRFCTGTPDQMRTIMGETFECITTSGSNIKICLQPLMERITNREKSKEGWIQLMPVIVKIVAEK